ncbi:MAG: tetratricopeptide repeat protein [Anaerolineales bacterium]|nr:tetratricopeptide repeat protein [Anaerolineales bacterium]
MVEEEFLPQDEAEDGESAMLREAIEALRQRDRVRARDLLTRLLKVDQKNPDYWIWLSAAVESQKERLYCLQTALQIDPDNAAAKRGLILLGALPPDDSVAPFPLHHARLWEETLKIESEPEVKEGQRGLANPVVRFLIIVGAGLGLVALFYFGFLVPRGAGPSIWGTPLRRSTDTITPTPTTTPVFRTVTPTFSAPTPLWMLLDATYTPTPLYVLTPHPPTSSDAFSAGLRYFQARDYENARVLMQQVIDIEPEAADAYFYIGESYRLQGNYQQALAFYEEAIRIDGRFAPAFLGRALVYHILNPDTDVTSYYEEAISLDPQFTLAYLARAAYRIERANWQGALNDLRVAVSQDPNSALAYHYMARVQLIMGRNEEALESALKANQLDITLLDNYLVLGHAYVANNQLSEAVGALQLYTLYVPNDPLAYAILGAAYNAAGEYRLAIDVLDRSIELYRHNGEAYYQRGFAYLHIGNFDQAERDFSQALGYDPEDYDPLFGLAMSYYQQEQFGNAFLQLEKVLGAADTDEQRAQALYWEAVCLDELNDRSSRQIWRRLLELPEEAMPSEWRQAAYEALGVTPTLTPTPRATHTRTPTPEP